MKKNYMYWAPTKNLILTLNKRVKIITSTLPEKYNKNSYSRNFRGEFFLDIRMDPF